MGLILKKLKEKIIYQGNFLTLRRDYVELPDKKETTIEFIKHPGAACVLAIDCDDNVLMIEQYRYPISRLTYELPAGKMNFNEDPIKCAYREFDEETGYKAVDLQLLGELYPASAYTDEKIYIFFTSNIIKGKAKLDDEEFLIVKKIPFIEVKEKVLKNEIIDAKTQISILKYCTVKGR